MKHKHPLTPLRGVIIGAVIAALWATFIITATLCWQAANTNSLAATYIAIAAFVAWCTIWAAVDAYRHERRIRKAFKNTQWPDIEDV